MAKFKPGQSGNPRGRPKKGTTLTDLLEKKGCMVDVTMTEDGREVKISRREALADKMWRAALADPNGAAARYIFDRIDGRPIETVRGDPEGAPIVVHFDPIYQGA